MCNLSEYSWEREAYRRLECLRLAHENSPSRDITLRAASEFYSWVDYGTLPERLAPVYAAPNGGYNVAQATAAEPEIPQNEPA